MEGLGPAERVASRLEREHALHRSRVVEAVAWAVGSFPVAAISLGGDLVTLRIVLPLIAVSVAALITIALVRTGRVRAGTIVLSVITLAVAADAHVGLRVSVMAPAYGAIGVALGAMVLPRREATVHAIWTLLAVAAMSVARVWTGDGTESWFPTSLDAVTLVVLIAVLGFVERGRVERDRVLLYEAVDDVDRQRIEVERSRNLAEASADAAREASDLKSRFLARVSHELRTPLNAILGYGELVQEEDELPLEARADIERICTAARHQLRLVDDLLDLSRIEAGHLDLRLEHVLLSDLVQPVIDAGRALARTKDVKIRSVVGSEPVRVDSGRVRQILLNLVSNAVRFTEHGEVTILAASGPEGLSLTVSDTGIGIRRSRLGQLCQPFAQAEPETAYLYGGTGLGLVITDRLVRGMGGTLQIDSEIGRGTAVRVTLPHLAHDDPSLAPLEPVRALAG